MFKWARRTSQHATMSNVEIAKKGTAYREVQSSILFGWKNLEHLDAMTAKLANAPDIIGSSVSGRPRAGIEDMRMMH